MAKGPAEKLALEAVGCVVFVATFYAMTALRDPTSPVRLWLASQSDDFRSQWREAKEALRFKNTARREINRIMEGELS